MTIDLEGNKIGGVFVKHDLIGKGIGTKLMDFMESKAKKKGIKNVKLYPTKFAMGFYKKRGYKIVERNYRKPWGEIDIIAKDGDCLVFVEVKANSREFRSKDFSPETRVDKSKVGKIIKTALIYLESKGLMGDRGQEINGANSTQWRIDVVAVTFIKEEKKAEITHFKNVADDIF